MNDPRKKATLKQPSGNYLHAQHDRVTKTEQIIVQKYNRRMFAVGLALAIIVPPLIYKWKRESMAVDNVYRRKWKMEPKKILRECTCKVNKCLTSRRSIKT